MKRLSLYLFLILFSFQTSSWADDISDFQIEGMSIGDSLLDYFSEREIINNTQDKQYPKSDKFIISLFVNESFFQIYKTITIKYKKNDNNFIIHNISGGIYYNDNFNNCLNKMTEVEKDLSILFNKAEKRKGSKKHSYDKSGKSIIHAIEYDLESGGTIQIKCTDWSEAINMIDNLSISVTTDEFVNFILTEAY